MEEKTGVVKAFSRPTGQINGKYFHINVVEGGICNGKEVKYFENENGHITRVIGDSPKVLNNEKEIIEEQLREYKEDYVGIEEKINEEIITDFTSEKDDASGEQEYKPKKSKRKK